ncbi:hypothetical protein QBC35DRAFT_502766 [Podospora australis]|uniref:Uncharacterized protein n=1 Tax=Podospora australis TaxID=1536484 RepID=A0AAN6WQ33_9PEZI|nr:hypothetical protein QBC35DRAFT_502766 [Podospora australis]
MMCAGGRGQRATTIYAALLALRYLNGSLALPNGAATGNRLEISKASLTKVHRRRHGNMGTDLNNGPQQKLSPFFGTLHVTEVSVEAVGYPKTQTHSALFPKPRAEAMRSKLG